MTSDRRNRDLGDYGNLSAKTKAEPTLWGSEVTCSDNIRGVQCLLNDNSGAAHGANAMEGCNPSCLLDEVTVSSGWVLVWNTLRSEYDAKPFTADSVNCDAANRWVEIVYDGVDVTLQVVPNLTDGSAPVALWQQNNTILDIRMSRKTRTRNADEVVLPFDTIVGGLNSATKFRVVQVDGTNAFVVDSLTGDIYSLRDVQVGRHVVMGAGNTVDGVDVGSHTHTGAGTNGPKPQYPAVGTYYLSIPGSAFGADYQCYNIANIFLGPRFDAPNGGYFSMVNSTGGPILMSCWAPIVLPFFAGSTVTITNVKVYVYTINNIGNTTVKLFRDADITNNTMPADNNSQTIALNNVYQEFSVNPTSGVCGQNITHAVRVVNALLPDSTELDVLGAVVTYTVA